MLIKFAGNVKLGETGMEVRALQICEKDLNKADSLSANFSDNANCKSENDKMVLESAGKDLVAMTTHKLAMSQLSFHSKKEPSIGCINRTNPSL